MFKVNKDDKFCGNNTWSRLLIFCLGINVLIFIAADMLAKTIKEQAVVNETLVLWHTICFYVFCFNIIMIYVFSFKVLGFFNKEGIPDYCYIRFLDVRNEIGNVFIKFYLNWRILITWLFIVLYWILIMSVLWAFKQYITIINFYTLSNLFIIVIGEIGRYYYIQKAKKLGCLPEKHMDRIGSDEAIKDFDKLTYIALLITFGLAIFFMISLD